ncbi:MAG: hypothetical protein QME48_03275 [bacterium]|uniref:Uncharacterized protein n=2 Tax=Bacteria candidate phyla TaxID=1783234 RepID=A0A101HZY4_UNCT6|nr:MAG: hypothetical protein XD76_1746 [candidate division TA06 bacterium 32_111]KUK85693.1 MAG: hypothetical protein XE03_1937 [candidate division TA06 bacterium 34_109]MDI6700234.1 hypothetical protein [bacterium]HAF08105.1 hypothetical protein [candidate division WOR-3 bacterium]HCP16585.1 hypothetical protein [candidate division WOR-3 bacterium]
MSKEQVFVLAYFGKGKIVPRIFFWKGKVIKVEKLTYSWKTVDEGGMKIHFSIISGSFYYHLLYSLSTSRWYLIDVESAIV